MMLKERPPTTPPATPVHRGATAKAREADTRLPQTHADYDRQPLRVNSLDHYIKLDTDDRFHVH